MHLKCENGVKPIDRQNVVFHSERSLVVFAVGEIVILERMLEATAGPKTGLRYICCKNAKIENGRIGSIFLKAIFLASTLILFSCTVSSPSSGMSDASENMSFDVVGPVEQSQIDEAVKFLNSACVTGGESLQITRTDSGSLNMKSLNNVDSVTLNKSSLEGFADAASALGASQATEMRECMQPYVDKILSVMLTSYSQPGQSGPEISSEMYFRTQDFDRVIKRLIDQGAGIRPSIYYDTRPRINPTVFRHYTDIAIENGLLDVEKVKNKTNGSEITFTYYLLTRKGVSYAISRGLAR